MKRTSKKEVKEVKEPVEEKTAEPEKQPEVEVSKAPAPITPLNGRNAGTGVPIDDKGEFTGTPAEWRALRKAGKIK